MLSTLIRIVFLFVHNLRVPVCLCFHHFAEAEVDHFELGIVAVGLEQEVGHLDVPVRYALATALIIRAFCPAALAALWRLHSASIGSGPTLANAALVRDAQPCALWR